MPPGHVIDIMIIGFLQITVLQFLKSKNSLGVIDLSLQHHPYFNIRIIQRNIFTRLAEKILALFILYIPQYFIPLLSKYWQMMQRQSHLCHKEIKKQILLTKTRTIWKMAKEKSKGIWSVMVL